MNHCEWCDFRDEEWLLFETPNWSVYLADVQDYVGRCILVSKRHCGSLSALDMSEWIDLKTAADRIEKIYREVLGADLSNWSCLMNSFYKSSDPNPHLHIHVRPRHRKPFEINGNSYADTEFAHHYALKKEDRLADEDRKELYVLMKRYLKANPD